MRIAVMSDIHGNLPALQAVMADIERRGVDVVVNLGNMVSGPLMPLQTGQLLARQDWLQIAGNHDPQVLDAPTPERSQSDRFAAAALDDPLRLWLRGLVKGTDPRLHQGSLWPQRLGDDVALCHASPRSDVEYLLETPEGEALRVATAEEIDERLGQHLPGHIRLLLCGHSHLPRVVRRADGLLIVNPGAVGLPAYDVSRPYPLSSYHRVENGSPDARYAVAEKRDGVWQADLLSVPYDHESMARLAARHGRPEWEMALRTGYWPRLL